MLVRYFEVRFDPSRPIVAGEADALRQEILAALDAITSLDDDRILRNHLGTVDATVRTNAFLGRPHLSFKFASAAVPLMPKPSRCTRSSSTRPPWRASTCAAAASPAAASAGPTGRRTTAPRSSA